MAIGNQDQRDQGQRDQGQRDQGQRDQGQRQQEQARLTRHGLFTDIRGGAASPALLFLHGGPGQGCYDFMALQGDRLARGNQVIGVDQRGVDRSAPLTEDATVTIADLVDDCEELRKALGVERWAVLGHSFGGMLALRYATSYPDAVTAVIFENPAVDIALASRAALPRVAALLRSLGREEPARVALAALDEADRDEPERAAADGDAADGNRTARALRLAYWTALAALGEERETFFIPDPETRARLEQIHAARSGPERGEPEPGAQGSGPGLGSREGEPRSEPGEEQASNDSTRRHHLAVVADDAVYAPGLPLLPRLPAPALLITGGRDPVTNEELRAAFRDASPANRLIEFGQAGHFVHADDPGAYAAVITGFLARTNPHRTG